MHLDASEAVIGKTKSFEYQRVLKEVLRDNWSNLFIDIEVNAHTRQRSQNITEKYASVSLVIPPRLQRNFNCNLWDLRPLPECRVLFAQIAVFLNVTPSLTHHPYRNTFGRLPASSTDEKRVHCIARCIGIGKGHRGGLR
ncbi:hypothetical protein ACHAXS_004700 [Conticribra weissflogii]